MKTVYMLILWAVTIIIAAESAYRLGSPAIGAELLAVYLVGATLIANYFVDW